MAFTSQTAKAARAIKALRGRKWYHRLLSQVVLGELTLNPAQRDALGKLARSKGWDKPPKSIPGKPGIARRPEITDDLAERLQTQERF